MAAAIPRVPYTTILEQATSEWPRIAPHRETAAQIPLTIQTWGELYKEWSSETVGLEARFWREVDAYIAFRAVREDLKRILDIYQKAIYECPPPIIDEGTITAAERLGSDMKPFRTAYATVFKGRLPQVEQQRDEIQKLLETVTKDLLTLRGHGEPLAKLYSSKQEKASLGNTLYRAVATVFNYTTTVTLTFTDAVEKRMQAPAAKAV